MKHSCDCYLGNAKGTCVSKVPLFNDLSSEELLELSSIIKKATYKKGEILLNAGDINRSLIFINKGKLKIYRISEAGREQILRILSPGDFTGELSIFNDSMVPNNIEASEDSEVCFIEKDGLKNLILSIPSISLKLLKELSERLMKAETLIEHLGIHDVEQRLVSFLLELSKKNENHVEEKINITLPMSKKDLASYIGTTQETLSRKLSRLQKQGVIKLIGQRKITVLNEKRLEDILTT